MEIQEPSDTILEILQADVDSEWRLLPRKRTEYPIIVRNGTAESHDVEISIVEPIEWATLHPPRLSLGPAAEASTRLVFSAGIDSNAAAGEHRLTIAVHDFEGTSLGQLVGRVTVAPYYSLELSIGVRGPLLRRGNAEGFVLHCKAVNRGNAECTVHPQAEAGCGISLAAPTVRVPVGGDVSFDLQAFWESNPMRNYPAAVKVRAPYEGGEALAEVPWDAVVAHLGSLIPPLYEDEEFPDIVKLRPIAEHVAGYPLPPTLPVPLLRADSTQIHETEPSDEPVTPAGPVLNHIDPAADAPAPARLEISAPRRMKYTYGRRVNPWWPPAECFGGRWRLKPFPFLIVAIVCAGLFLAQFHRPPVVANIAAPHRAPHAATVAAHIRVSRAKAQSKRPEPAPKVLAARGQPPKHPHALSSSIAALPRSRSVRPKAKAAPTPFRAARVPLPVPTMLVRNEKVPKGAVWEGSVIHVSAGNVKVYDPAEHATRSFIVSQNFKSVFSADGALALSMNQVRPGADVRVFYSYLFGFRHPNAIFIMHPARSHR